jgi:fermentation-respiration switch protein FrsA (DUF1100 family)
MKRDIIKRLLVGEFTFRRLVRSMLLIVVLVYLSFAAFAWFVSDRLLFMPPPASYAHTPELITLTTHDGVRLAALYLPQPTATYTILYSHGNGEDIGQLRYLFDDMQQLGFAVLAYDYRGYGTSSGQPDETGVYADVSAAYRYLVEEQKVAPDKIIALGRSLGGGAAIDLAAREKLGGLIIESSFVSAFRVLTQVPLLPFDKFRNLSKMPRVTCPVLVIHGAEDEVISYWHGEKLFQAAPDPKQLLRIDGGHHNDLQIVAGSRYNRALRDFARLLATTQP